MGILSRDEAMSVAARLGLDLVEVSPNTEPPVARIIDWGKYQYQKRKQLKKSRGKQKRQDLKQIRMGLKIGEHDFNIKVSKIKQFLEEGHKVRVSAFFRGREMAHKENGYQLLDKVLEKIEDSAVVEQEPQMSGRYLTMQIRKKK